MGRMRFELCQLPVKTWAETMIVFGSLCDCDRGTGPCGRVGAEVIAQPNFPQAAFFMFHFQAVGATGAIKIHE